MFKFLSINNATIYDTILLHEDLLIPFEHFMNKEFPIDKMYSQMGAFMPSFFSGLQVKTDRYVPKHPLRWKFPDTPFVEYESSDELWAKPLRFGRYIEDTSSYVVYLIKLNKPLLKEIKLFDDLTGIYSSRAKTDLFVWPEKWLYSLLG